MRLYRVFFFALLFNKNRWFSEKKQEISLKLEEMTE